MNRRAFSRIRSWALTSVAAAAIAGPAWAEDARHFEIPQQSLVAALEAFGKQGDAEILFSKSAAEGRSTSGLSGEYEPAQALALLLDGSGLKYRQVNANTYVIEAQVPQGGSAAEGGATVEALIVTAQKREEDIQDVPIAISAFSQKQLDAQKIEGGFDLLKAIPNVTFTKTNFTSYNFQIRGIGTQATSATTDPGVAVAFNNSGIIQNRLFEQEYVDMERVEVLRGPQGTLYGRNATAGVINVISAKPRIGEFLAEVKGEVANYNATRMRGMINIPVGDTVAVRLAAAGTVRDGYTFNSGTGRQVDGRDLWSGRLTVGWEPTPQIRANLIWEHFEEDDDRLRTGKQLCHRNDVYQVGDIPLDDPTLGTATGNDLTILRAIFSQGCEPGSLFDEGAYDTPNGLAVNFINGILLLRRNGVQNISTAIGSLGSPFVTTGGQAVLQPRDPYGGRRQSRDLRQIESIRDPVYRASADMYQLNIDFDLTDSLAVFWQTTYVDDETYSFQDFNRFNTDPIFTNTSETTNVFGNDYSALAPGGIFCDPQIGCSDRLAGFDIAQATAEQFNQELRLQSSFDGPVNFSLGANYTKFDTLIDYYVMYNVLSALAMTLPLNDPGGANGLGGGSNVFGDPDGPPTNCATSNFWNNFPIPGNPGLSGPVPTTDINSPCPYVDPNPIESINGEGHNYFRSKNPYELKSWAAFGELYWNIRDDLKLTAGLRYTDDRKTFDVIPSQTLLAPSYIAGGTVSVGYPVLETIKQHWGEFSGRVILDWKPELDFTDETLVYASYSRGYKGGGANPPTPGFATLEQTKEILLNQGYSEASVDLYASIGTYPVLKLTGQEYGKTFDPEFVDAFELGAKNTILNGAATLNMTAFYYDYTDYQVSQIRDRTAVNENFDAEMWGLELEAMFAPSRDFQIIANLGYLDTKIANGETSIDIMNRTQGNPNYTVVKPWIQNPSNCVVPTHIAEYWLNGNSAAASFVFCGVGGILGIFSGNTLIDTNPDVGGGVLPYDKSNYPELNGGSGLVADLGGNQLANSPHWTTNIGGQYTFHLPQEWRLVVRGDAYWQSQSYHRVYNTEPYDKLHGWYNANLVVWAENDDLGLHIEAYVKNLIDNDPITGAFLNSDDTALTTNVFMLDPRLYGISVRKSF